MRAGTGEGVLYFAYGGNMSADVLARRLPREKATSYRRRRAVLPDHKLVFNKMSSTDPAVGYANVVPAPGHEVEGILNELEEAELVKLDAIELVPHHYARAQLMVRDADNTRPMAAQVYRAQPAWIRPQLRPLRGYLENLLGGADLLSADYVATLRAVPCRD